MSKHNSQQNPAAAIHDAASAALEDLEGRQLLANDPLAVGTLSSGGAWLNVTGTANDDAIVVNQTTKGVYTITNGTWSLTKKGTFVGVRVSGAAGNDSVRFDGVAARVSVNGEAGNDTLVGGSLNDVLNGGLGDDSVDGGAGNDTINGQAGSDTLNGGDGNDSLLGDLDIDSLYGNAGNDTLNGGAGNDALDGGADNDRLVAGADLGADGYAGGAGLDTIDYTGRTVALTISLDGVANDGASGESDNVATDFEIVIGGNAADAITGDDDANTLQGGAGADTIRGAGGDDSILGGAGLDAIYGDAGNDTVRGEADADQLFGGEGDDLLEGGAGADALDGGAGIDSLISIGGGNADSVTGGDGLDSYWLDSDASEKVIDVSDAETAARAIHRVTAFVKTGSAAVSKDVLGQKIADPAGTGKLNSFAGNKLFAAAGPGEDDIAQGQVGDCWYMSGLAAIAKTMPEVLKQSITALGDGTYAVRFVAAGVEKYVRVDADLWTYSWSATTPAYASTGAEGSLWAPLMEKALTWVRGRQLGKYATISAGWMTETNSFLGLSNANLSKTGGMTTATMLDWLKQQLDAGKAVSAGFLAVQQGSGLIGSHAYTIDRINDNGDGSFSVTLRNPWGVDGYGSTDGANDGHITIAADTLLANFAGLTAAA